MTHPNSSSPLHQKLTTLQTQFNTFFTTITTHFNTPLTNFTSFTSPSPPFTQTNHTHITNFTPFTSYSPPFAHIPHSNHTHITKEEFVLVKGSNPGNNPIGLFFTNIITHLNTHLTNFTSFSSSTPPFANIPHYNHTHITKGKKHGLTDKEIEDRLSGVAVYALSNSNEEFVLVKGSRTGRSLGLFCLCKDDAASLLNEMKLINPSMRNGSDVVPVALNKVFQLKLNGVAFRLIPEASQIKNALKEKEKAGFTDDEFSGVPVFQSRSLILRTQNKSYRPAFFRKEDLENSLLRASQEQQKLNPLYRRGDIEVSSLEDAIKGMKDETCSKWDDIIFIPPGFDVSTDPSQLR